MEDSDRHAWDHFVFSHAEGTFFHRAGWAEVISRAFGHEKCYLLAESAEGIQGVLPLVRVKSLLFGHALVSTPFCVYGGVLANSLSAHTALIESAIERAERYGVDHVEIRNRSGQIGTHLQEEFSRLEANGGTDALGKWPEKDLHVTFINQIAEDEAAILKSIPRKQRAEVRRGIKAGLTTDDHFDADLAYRVYSESVRNLGTPIFTPRFFPILREVFGKDCRTLIIRHKGEPVTAVLSFYYKNEVLPYYGGGTRAARRTGAYAFMYWHLMCRARDEGVDIFDFGRSKKESGSYHFKCYFGFKPQPLHYAFYLRSGEALPDLNPNNPKYKLFIQLWKKMPLGVSRTVGPFLAKHLG